MLCLEYFCGVHRVECQTFQPKVSCDTQKIPVMCLELLRPLQKLYSLETTNLEWSLEKYHRLPCLVAFSAGRGPLFLQSRNGAVQKGHPSSNNRILNKHTSSLILSGIILRYVPWSDWIPVAYSSSSNSNAFFIGYIAFTVLLPNSPNNIS